MNETRSEIDPMPTETLDASTSADGERTETLSDLDRNDDRRLEPGRRLGRYLILEAIGQGGMGRVYAAYDPKLGRKVALKVLRGRVGDTARTARLLREARALARLNHANVLAVFDADEVDGLVFLTTEFVQGVTFDRWLRDTAPSRRRALEALIQAGRGLDAAHRADLVHRDFKGGNVMVAEDGRVLVLDFGLARDRSGSDARDLAEAPSEEAEPRVAATPSADKSSVGEALTRAGARVGTPAFMAPEQRVGHDVGPAADQFSFCVVAMQALTGVFPAQDQDQKAAHSLPRRLRRPLLRGLELDPEDRHPSLHHLLAELEKAMAFKRRMGWAALLLATLWVGGLWTWQQGPRREALCAAGADAWDEVVGEERLAWLGPGGSDGSPLASTTSEAAIEALAGYGRSWRGMYRQACEATHRFGRESQALLDLRMACLAQRLREVDAALGLLESSGRPERLSQLVVSLEAVTSCADTRALRSPIAPPEGADLEPLSRRLAELKALWLVGDYQAGLDAARELAGEAAEVAHWPLIAEVGIEQARFLESLEEAEAADAVLIETLLAAGTGSHLKVAAEASVRQVRVLGILLSRTGEAEEAARRAKALIAQLSDPRLLGGELDELLGVMAARDGRHEQAKSLLESSLEAKEAVHGPDHLSLAATLSRLAETARAEARLDDASDLLSRALAINRRHLGAEHANIAGVHARAGAVALEAGRATEALEHQDEALRIRRRVYGEGHVRVGISMAERAGALTWLGRFDEAAGDFQEALEIFEARFGPSHGYVAIALANLASTRIREGRPDDAIPLFARALQIQRELYGDGHPQVASVLFNLGEATRRGGRPREALARLEQAAAIWRDQGDAASEMLADAQTAIGESWLDLGRPERALPKLEASWRERSATRRPDLWAKNAFALARALEALQMDRKRALRLAHQARESYAKTAATHGTEMIEIDRWLAEQEQPEADG